jgi:hypothetical protein
MDACASSSSTSLTCLRRHGWRIDALSSRLSLDAFVEDLFLDFVLTVLGNAAVRCFRSGKELKAVSTVGTVESSPLESSPSSSSYSLKTYSHRGSHGSRYWSVIVSPFCVERIMDGNRPKNVSESGDYTTFRHERYISFLFKCSDPTTSDNSLC